jgi:hypothetical protein
MTSVDLNLSSDTRAGEQTVYIKQLWTDDWTPVAGARCASASWGTIPSIGQALIERRYGIGSYPGESIGAYKSPLSLDHYFIKVAFTHPDATLQASLKPWYGTVEIEEDERGEIVADAEGTLRLSGCQRWHCFELGHLLDRTPITNGYFLGDGGPEEIGTAPTFNHRGVANRSKILHEGRYYFSKLSGEEEAGFWATSEIMSYLLHNTSPVEGTENGPAFPLYCDDTSFHQLLPEWDRPELDVHGKTLWQALGQLLNFERGLGGYLAVDEDNPPNEVRIWIFTYTDVEVTLGDEENGGGTLLANPTQYKLIVDGRPDLGTSLKRAMDSAYHRVLIEGRRRRAVATLNPGSSASEFVAHWTQEADGEEDKFNLGASEQDDYGSLDEDDAQKRNDAVRRENYPHVFARFKIREDWDGKTGAGVSTELEDLHPVFPDDERDDSDPTQVYGNWPEGWRLSQSLPLYRGVDYSGSKIENGELPEIVDSETPFMPCAVYVPGIGGEPPYFNGADGGVVLSTADDEEQMALRMRVEDDRPVFWLDVVGAKQQVIAGDAFEPLPEDITYDNPYDWQEFLVTVCFEEQRKARITYPELLPLAGFEIAAIRTKHIDVGDGYCLDYVVPNTVVGIKPDGDGELLRSDGGYARDDRPRMKALAAQLYEFYKKVRRVLRLEKTGFTGELWLGNYISHLGGDLYPNELLTEVGTVVTEVSVVFPPSSSPPLTKWETNQGEIDSLIVPVHRRRKRT